MLSRPGGPLEAGKNDETTEGIELTETKIRESTADALTNVRAASVTTPVRASVRMGAAPNLARQCDRPTGIGLTTEAGGCAGLNHRLTPVVRPHGSPHCFRWVLTQVPGRCAGGFNR